MLLLIQFEITGNISLRDFYTNLNYRGKLNGYTEH